jgi:hypothetical protein
MKPMTLTRKLIAATLAAASIASPAIARDPA